MNCHPYYSYHPESGNLPVYNKVSMKEEGKPRINFLYKQTDHMVETVPSALKRIEAYGSNKVLSSNKSLEGDMYKLDKADKVESSRKKDMVNAEYFGVADSIPMSQGLRSEESRSRRERSSSLKEIEDKIAFSRKMFPY